MRTETLSEISTRVTNFLTQRVKQLGKETQFVQRQSKLTAEVFVQTLVTSQFMDPQMSLEGLCDLMRKKQVTLTKQALHERFNAQASLLLSRLFEQAVVLFRQQQLGGIDLLAGFSAVEIQDSTYISLPRALEALFPGYGGVASTAGMKIQVLFNYTQSCIDQAYVTGARVNDQSFDCHLQALKTGVLYLQDLGYFKLASLRKIAAAGSYYITRYLSNTFVADEHGNRLDLVKELQSYQGSVFCRKVILGQGTRAVPLCRLVATRLPQEDVQKRRNRLIEEARKKRNYFPSAALLALAEWSIYVTNVPEEMLTDEQIGMIYRLRWQVELFFKLCKSHAGLAQLTSQNPHRVLCGIYAKLISVVLMLYFCQPIRWQEKQEISFDKAYQQMRYYAESFLASFASLYRIKQWLTDFMSGLKQFALKDKCRKKRLLSYQWLMNATAQEVLA